MVGLAWHGLAWHGFARDGATRPNCWFEQPKHRCVRTHRLDACNVARIQSCAIRRINESIGPTLAVRCPECGTRVIPYRTVPCRAGEAHTHTQTHTHSKRGAGTETMRNVRYRTVRTNAYYNSTVTMHSWTTSQTADRSGIRRNPERLWWC